MLNIFVYTKYTVKIQSIYSQKLFLCVRLKNCQKLNIVQYDSIRSKTFNWKYTTNHNYMICAYRQISHKSKLDLFLVMVWVLWMPCSLRKSNLLLISGYWRRIHQEVNLLTKHDLVKLNICSWTWWLRPCWAQPWTCVWVPVCAYSDRRDGARYIWKMERIQVL